MKDDVRGRRRRVLHGVLIFLRAAASSAVGRRGAVGDAEGILVEVLLIRRGRNRVAISAVGPVNERVFRKCPSTN